MKENCPKCHVVVRPTDYFCFNCGNNLKPAPPPIDTSSQLILYIKSFLLPPFGVLWAVKYLRHDDEKSKIVGIVAVALTLISFIVSMIIIKNLMDDVNKQVNEQMNSLSF